QLQALQGKKEPETAPVVTLTPEASRVESVSPPKADGPTPPPLQLGALSVPPAAETQMSPRSDGATSPKRPPPRVPEPSLRTAFAMSSEHAPAAAPPPEEPQHPSPRFEPLEEFAASPVLSRDSRRRAPPPPPSAAAATAVAATAGFSPPVS